jgi:ATP-dependent helicase/nuclease subunit B
MNVYNIPAGYPFLETLARSLLDRHADNLLGLSDTRIFLPTRRGCRNLRDSFLKVRHGQPILLPAMQPIGDVDDDAFLIELSAKGLAEEYLSIPPAIPALRRQFLLARLIMQLPDFAQSWDSAISLARALGTLMDQIYTENLNIQDLPLLVREEDLAEHWQITVKFLEILSHTWPKILEDEGFIDAADRRNRLIMTLAEFWDQHPPQTPIIAAGSTGSIPATSRLLKTIASLPQGSVILPGLDQDLDQKSWDALGSNNNPEAAQRLIDVHPQATLKSLLENLSIERTDIKTWHLPASHLTPHKKRSIDTRRWLMTEVMRPAETTEKWRELGQDSQHQTPLKQALNDIEIYHCATSQEEALTIGMIIRAALNESQDKTIALITPDRDLAARVQAITKRWDINIDDSAGYNLNQSSIGGFIDLTAKVITNDFSPAALAACLKHTKCHFGLSAQDYYKGLAPFEEFILRGYHGQKGIEGLQTKHAQQQQNDYITITDTQNEQIVDFIQRINDNFAPLTELIETDKGFHTPQTWLKAHLEVIERCAGVPNDEKAFYIWSNEEGEVAATFIKDFASQAAILPSLSFPDFAAIFKLLMQSATIRPQYGLHPRIHILGQLEARLINADVVILSGLNEGTWPAQPSADPWMSRPMRGQFGLPTAERSTGLAAHDFSQAFCSPQVFITRADRQDGTPTTPARWLQRLDTVLKACNLSPNEELSGPYLNFARELNHAKDEAEPAHRPAPTPPANRRPTRLSVTAIERWMRDPYSIYAQYVLKLKKLDDIEPNMDAARRGTLIHDILDTFVTENTATLTDTAEEQFLAIAKNILDEQLHDPAQVRLWWPRIKKIATWFVDHERKWRDDFNPYLSEQKGAIELDCGTVQFTLHAKADRIDLSADKTTLAIVDYKTGMPPTKKDIAEGFASQLPLEALIASKGGFNGQEAELEASYFG